MSSLFDAIKKFFGKHPIIANLLLIIATGMFLIWIALLFLDGWTHHGDDATVPTIKGLPYNEAAAALENADLSIEISDSIYDRHASPGTIIESWPKAGAVVKRGRQVYVTVTSFSPKMITLSMPVTGVSSRQAISYLEALGINSIRIVSVPSQYTDLVEGAYCDGRTVGVGSQLPVTATVTLEVGSAPVSKPDSLDAAIDDATGDIIFDLDQPTAQE